MADSAETEPDSVKRYGQAGAKCTAEDEKNG